MQHDKTGNPKGSTELGKPGEKAGKMGVNTTHAERLAEFVARACYADLSAAAVVPDRAARGPAARHLGDQEPLGPRPHLQRIAPWRFA